MALAPGYILHQYAYRDSSRIIEAFTAEHGRLTLFARGASAAKSSLRGLLQPFQRLLFSWSGRGEACTLVAAEIDGVHTMLGKDRLMSGFYLNELLLKLMERWDPHPDVFFSYASCIEALCAGAGEEAALRRFEKRLLNDLGYGLQLTRTEERRHRSQVVRISILTARGELPPKARVHREGDDENSQCCLKSILMNAGEQHERQGDAKYC